MQKAEPVRLYSYAAAFDTGGKSRAHGLRTARGDSHRIVSGVLRRRCALQSIGSAEREKEAKSARVHPPAAPADCSALLWARRPAPTMEETVSASSDHERIVLRGGTLLCEPVGSCGFPLNFAPEAGLFVRHC